ncbi:MAG: gamma carbonic anhydrase family protein [Gammaproteobacteria bacterium]|nr:gamma carbonic anhydrase family protein [Gammaproteobacteria bacterium]
MAVRHLGRLIPRVNTSAFIDESAQVIGDVELGQDSSVWPMAVIRGDIQKIIIGQNTNIQDGCVLHVTHDSQYQPGGCELRVGDYVTVGHGVILHGCTINDHCLIGMGSTIMDNAVLEENVMLAAGSLVTPGKVLKSGYLYVGSPAKAKRLLTREEIEYFEYAANHYVKLKNQYKSGDNTTK